MTWLIRFYPPAWRRRYGRELAELLAAQPASFRTAVDLVAGAVDAWLNPQSSTAVTAANAQGAGAMVPKMLKLRFAGYGANVATADDIKKVWLPGAGSCLLFFGFYWVLIWLPFDKTRFQFLAIPYLVLPFVGALAAYWSRRMNGSVLERIVAALFPVFAFVALFAVRIVYGLFFEGVPYTLPHFLAGFSVTLVFIVVGGLLLVLGAWPFCRSHLSEQLP
jgi:hypothetical protein